MFDWFIENQNIGGKIDIYFYFHKQHLKKCHVVLNKVFDKVCGVYSKEFSILSNGLDIFLWIKRTNANTKTVLRRFRVEELLIAPQDPKI